MFTQPRHEHTRELIAAGKPRARALARSPIGGDLLELRGVTRLFAHPGRAWFGRTMITALDGVSFSIKAVESVALIGGSGAGKSTLARLIVGLDRVSEGELVFDRETYHGSDLPHGLRPDISLVFQDPFASLDPHLTVGQSIAEPLRLLPQIAPTQRLLRVEEALAAVGLAPDARKARPREFSGLDRQRIAVARALVTRPRLVVLDEPLSALDVSERAEMLGLLTRLRADFSLACLIISPDLDPVRPMADRVLIMSEGRIVEVARPTELFTTPRHAVTEALLKARLPDIG